MTVPVAPDGETVAVIGCGGVGLSAVMIAAALAADPAILLLDEATSAVDSEIEADIQKALAELMQGRTTIAVAHRLSTIINADEIVVLDRGRVAERGRHAELLARNGLYADMWRRQQEADAEAERQVDEPPSFRAEGHLRVAD